MLFVIENIGRSIWITNNAADVGNRFGHNVIETAMCAFVSYLLFPTFLPLFFVVHSDIKVCSSWFHIQSVPLGQCLHHFGFLLLPVFLFFQSWTILQPTSLILVVTHLFSRDIAGFARWRREIVLWFHWCFNYTIQLFKKSTAQLLKIKRLFINSGNKRWCEYEKNFYKTSFL